MPKSNRKDHIRKDSAKMTISEKQLQANRANAQKSTGPRTEEGKARSAMNGFTSILTGLTAVMTDEDRIAQRKFVDAFIADCDPLGAVELQYARTLAHDNWRLNRIKSVEENIFAVGYEIHPGETFSSPIPQVETAFAHALSYITHADSLNKLSLYESRLSRNIARNTKLLAERQAQRPQRRAQPQTNEPLTKQNGFVQPLFKTASAPAPEVAETREKAA
jgi:hypothetical protein